MTTIATSRTEDSAAEPSTRPPRPPAPPVRPTGRVPLCEACGETEVELYCSCCGQELCANCWDVGGDDLCGPCVGLGWAERPVVDVEVARGLL